MKNNHSRKYINSIKALLPLLGSKEKRYLRVLNAKIEALCHERQVSNIYEIYDQFGYPQEVVYNYINTIDPADLVPDIVRYRKSKKAAVLLCMVVSVISIVVSSMALYIYKEAFTVRIGGYVQVLTYNDKDGNIHTEEVGIFP